MFLKIIAFKIILLDILKKIYDAIFITYENIIDLHECADLLYNQKKSVIYTL